jgi:hypothetical protein
MEWKEYINNHSTILKNSLKADTSEKISKNIPEKDLSTKRGNFILRQEIKSLTIFCSVKVSILINLFLFIIFISLGIYIIELSNNIKVSYLKYDNW